MFFLYRKVLFFLVFLFGITLFPSISVAQSIPEQPSLNQTSASYQNFLDLFSSYNGKPLLRRVGPAFDETGTIINGVTFAFSGQFETTATRNRKWFWDHIGYQYQGRTITQEEDIFVIRTCPVKTDTSGLETIESNTCLLSAVPNEVARRNEQDDPFFNKAFYIFTTLDAWIGNDWEKAKDAFEIGIPIRKFHPISQITGNSLADAPATSLVSGTKYQSDIWYCGETDTEIDEQQLQLNPLVETDLMRNFGTICGRRTYYIRIGQPITFIYSTNLTDPANTTTENINNFKADSKRDPSESNLPVCSWFGIGNGSFNGCIAKGVYFLIFKPIAWFASILGNLFDFFLGYSLDDASYRLDFAVNGWKLVRDIANIFFIIILVYTGFAAVFDIGNISMKKVVPALIINAFIINFSLFATRVVVDVSNIFARILYNTMNVTSIINGREVSINNKGPGGYRPLSEQILSAFDPQNIFSVQYISPEQAASGGARTPNEIEGSENSLSGFTPDKSGSAFDRNTRNYANFFIIISVVAAAILFAIAKMFWKVAFLFLGRVIGLYVAMIFSPFAFLTRGGIPLVGNIQQIKWSDWLRDLTNYAVLAPIFLLFLYVIYTFSTSDFVKSFNAFSSQDESFLGKILTITIPLLIIYTFISYGVTLAKKYSGTIGETVQDWASKATGFVGGAALGVASAGTAVAGRNILGRLGQRISRSQTLQNMSSRGGFRGNMANRFLNLGQGMSRSSYDIRSTQPAQRFQREFGLTGSNNRILGALNANQQQTTGGYQAAVQREVQRITRRAERFQLTGLQATQQNAQNRAWENTYQTARNNAQQTAIAQGQAFDEVSFRQTYTAAHVRPQTAEEINRQREQNHNAALQRGSTLARMSRIITNRGTTTTGALGTAQVAAGLSVLGGATIAGAAAIGEGSIQNEAQQTVANQRAGQARNPVSNTQRQNLETELNRLNSELTRVTQILSSIGQTFQPPIPGNQITQANLIDYRNNLNQQLVTLRQQITQDEDFIRLNMNNPAQAQAVQFRRQRINQNRGTEAQTLGSIRESQSILSEYNRINQRMEAIRTQLGI